MLFSTSDSGAGRSRRPQGVLSGDGLVHLVLGLISEKKKSFPVPEKKSPGVMNHVGPVLISPYLPNSTGLFTHLGAHPIRFFDLRGGWRDGAARSHFKVQCEARTGPMVTR